MPQQARDICGESGVLWGRFIQFDKFITGVTIFLHTRQAVWYPTYQMMLAKLLSSYLGIVERHARTICVMTSHHFLWRHATCFDITPRVMTSQVTFYDVIPHVVTFELPVYSLQKSTCISSTKRWLTELDWYCQYFEMYSLSLAFSWSLTLELTTTVNTKWTKTRKPEYVEFFILL